MSELGANASGVPLNLDVEKLIGSHMAIIANSGAGKSWTLRKVLELVAGSAQRIVLDPEDEFYTLREQVPSMVIAGGSNGDCPLAVESAAGFARFLLETGVDAVLQLNDLGLDGSCAFVAAFLRAAIDAPSSLSHPALFVLDEAQMFAGQSGVTESRRAVERFMAQARKRDFTGVLASQRMATISKSALAPANNWLLGRVGHATDRRAIADELGFGTRSQEAQDLRSLDDGRFWAFGPALAREPTLIRVREATTRHPQRGQRNIPTPPAPEQIRAMLERLRVEPPSSEQTISPSAAPSADKLAAAERRGYERGRADGEAQWRAWVEGAVVAPAEQAMRALTTLYAMLPRGGIDEPPPNESQNFPVASVKPAANITAPSGVEARILGALAELDGIGIAAAPRVQVAFLAGYRNLASKGFANGIGGLHTRGLVSYPAAGRIALTESGRSVAPIRGRALDNDELQSRIFALLGGPERRILRILIDRYPGAPERSALGHQAGYSNTASKGFANGLGRLRSLGFIDYPTPGRVVATSALFVTEPVANAASVQPIKGRQG